MRRLVTLELCVGIKYDAEKQMLHWFALGVTHTSVEVKILIFEMCMVHFAIALINWNTINLKSLSSPYTKEKDKQHQLDLKF